MEHTLKFIADRCRLFDLEERAKMDPKHETNSTEVIEITPAMIAVGVEAYAEFDPRFEREDGAVRRIFLAMMMEHKRRAGI